MFLGLILHFWNTLSQLQYSDDINSTLLLFASWLYCSFLLNCSIFQSLGGPCLFCWEGKWGAKNLYPLPKVTSEWLAGHSGLPELGQTWLKPSTASQRMANITVVQWRSKSVAAHVLNSEEITCREPAVYLSEKGKAIPPLHNAQFGGTLPTQLKQPLTRLGFHTIFHSQVKWSHSLNSGAGQEPKLHLGCITFEMPIRYLRWWDWQIETINETPGTFGAAKRKVTEIRQSPSC